jgi:transposase
VWPSTTAASALPHWGARCETLDQLAVIEKAGNQPARSLLVELAWGWLRHQPGSGLAAWYRRTFAERGQRGRKVGIVALARRLAIALWRYVENGVVPEGAVLSSR